MIINATLIDDRGSPSSFQCWEGFPEFLRRAADAIERGRGMSDGAPFSTLDRPIIRVFAYEAKSGKLTEYRPEQITELMRQAREMFAPVAKAKPANDR